MLKTTGKFAGSGACERVRVSDCELRSSSCALKIGTETVEDIRDVTFERCKIRSNRGVGIMLRDQGHVSGVTIREMEIETQLFDDVWWGKAEPIYLSVGPRSSRSKVGELSAISVSGVRCHGAGGVYVGGCKDSPVKQVTLKDVTVEVSGSGPREGGVLDLRPCPGQGLQKARTAGFRIEQADGVVLERCTVTWADRAAKWLGGALAMNAATHVDIVQFKR